MSMLYRHKPTSAQMEKPIIPTKALSRFLQLLDGNFPSGSFVHSFGLEAHVVLQEVQTADELEVYLHNILIDQYGRFEFPFIRQCFALLHKHDSQGLLRLDREFLAMLNYEHAKAAYTIGHNYLKHIHRHVQDPCVKAFYMAISLDEHTGSELAVLSAYAYALGLDEQSLILLWCKKSLVSLAGCTPKISRIQPSEIQQMLFRFDERMEEILKNTGRTVENFNPLFEEIMYQHTYLEPKLFTT